MGAPKSSKFGVLRGYFIPGCVGDPGLDWLGNSSAVTHGDGWMDDGWIQDTTCTGNF